MQEFKITISGENQAITLKRHALIIFIKIKNMEKLTDGFSNQTFILIERLFWLGLGGFLGLAIISSTIRGFHENGKTISPIELNNLAKKGSQRNKDNN
tara:strand:+ start:167 stop:460 length:294 start_codon:yes stop_codon:yes gene_type:complete